MTKDNYIKRGYFAEFMGEVAPFYHQELFCCVSSAG